MAQPYSPILLVQLSRLFGGADVRVLNVARALSQRQRSFMVAVLEGSRLHRLLQDERLASVPLPYRRGDPRHLLQLYRLIKRHGIRVVDAHNPQSQLWGLPAAYLAGVPTRIATVHTVYRAAHVGKGRRHEVALRMARRLGCRFICVSQSISDYLLSLGVKREQIMLSYNGVAPAQDVGMAGIRNRLGWAPDQPVVTMVARLSPAKGHTFLLRALQQVRSEFPQLRCLLVGDGVLRSTLEQESKQRGLEQLVHFAGFRQDVPAILAESDLFCLSSLAEGFPFALIEAAQMKLPLLVTGVDGMLEHLTPNIDAKLVPPGDSDALADALRWWLTNRDAARQMGEAACHLVQTKFDPARMVQDTLQAYDGSMG